MRAPRVGVVEARLPAGAEVARRAACARRGAAQVGTWMPLVTWRIGTAAGSRSGEKSRPHLAADLAVLPAHAVHRAREAHRERRHAERLPVVVGPAPAEGEELIARRGRARSSRRARWVSMNSTPKTSCAGGDGRVRREDALDFTFALASSSGVPARELLAQQLEREERRVALVHVEDASAARPSARSARTPPKPSVELLHEPGVLVAAVEVAGDPAVALLVVARGWCRGGRAARARRARARC